MLKNDNFLFSSAKVFIIFTECQALYGYYFILSPQAACNIEAILLTLLG